MVTVCCCQCDPRLATYAVALLSLLHFLMESALLYMLDDEHRLVAEDSGIKFLTVFITNLFLVFSSLLLFFAAYYLQPMLCIPWLIGCAFQLLLYIAIMVIIILRLVSDFAVVELEKLFFTMFQLGTVIYGMWLVITFMMELNSQVVSTVATMKARSMFKLYSEDETDAEVALQEEDLFPKKKSLTRKPTKTKAGDMEPLLKK